MGLTQDRDVDDNETPALSRAVRSSGVVDPPGEYLGPPPEIGVLQLEAHTNVIASNLR